MPKPIEIIINVKTGKRTVRECAVPIPVELPEPPVVDFKDLVKLITHAKSKEWI